MVWLSRILLLVLLVLLGTSIVLYRGGYLSIPSPATTTSNSGPAPGFVGIEHWLNSEPLRLADLRGKVVLVDFWTYTCINCQRTLPYLRSWHEKYADKGLVIVGVHSPEFAFEQELGNVADAVERYRVSWPVALDNEMHTWAAYNNHYWPHKYLVDKAGIIRYDHIGEGGYNETERVIQQLLSEGGSEVAGDLTEERPVPVTVAQTPELYAGYSRGVPGNEGGYHRDQDFTYRDPGDHGQDTIYVHGVWRATSQSLEHARSTSGLPDYVTLSYGAKDVFVVTAGTSERPYRVYVTLDGRPLKPGEAGEDVRFDPGGQSYVVVDFATLFHVVSTEVFDLHTLKLASDSSEFAIYAFTFGS